MLHPTPFTMQPPAWTLNPGFCPPLQVCPGSFVVPREYLREALHNAFITLLANLAAGWAKVGEWGVVTAWCMVEGGV